MNFSLPPLCICHSRLKKPHHCSFTVWGWFLRGQFMTMQPQKCCCVQQEEGNRQDSSEEALKSGRAAYICCSHKQFRCQVGMSLLKSYSMQYPATVVHPWPCPSSNSLVTENHLKNRCSLVSRAHCVWRMYFSSTCYCSERTQGRWRMCAMAGRSWRWPNTLTRRFIGFSFNSSFISLALNSCADTWPFLWLWNSSEFTNCNWKTHQEQWVHYNGWTTDETCFTGSILHKKKSQ